MFVDPAAETINGASIVAADDAATNGIVHTINQLFVIPTVTPSTTSTTTPGTTTSTTTPAG